MYLRLLETEKQHVYQPPQPCGTWGK